MRRGGLALAVAAFVVATSFFSAPVDAAESASSVAAAQRRANAAAARYAQAVGALAVAERKTNELKAQADRTAGELAGLESQVRQFAVRQYVNGGAEIAWLEAEDVTRAARTQAMVRFVRLGDTDAIDRYEALVEDLAVEKAALTRAAEAQRGAVSRLRTEEAAAQRELARLQEIQRRAEAAAAREAAARDAAARRSPTAAARPSRAAPAPSGGAARVIGSGNWICPVQGPRSFTNDWGFPRSGGRRHQGTDIMSPRGTEVVASVAGTVRHHGSRLGGMSYYLRGNDGNTYFGTHLSGYAASGAVAAGTVIGYVGNSGNASGGSPHLHFEIHPGGGGPTNPYPTLRQYC